MIPVHMPVLEGNEKKYVMDCLDSNWISSTGKYVEMFEKKFANYCNVKHGIANTSGTSALHLAVAALNLKKGDEVIIPSFTMIASALAVVYTGATPVFVDAEPETWTMDVAQIEKKITKKTKAIMAVPIYGHPCEMDAIVKITEKHNLFLIEDAAEAIGGLYKYRKMGSFGHINAFSFYSNKIITCGEGGMVVTNDDKLAERTRWLKNFCFDKERRYVHEEIGFKYPMTNIQAAIGLAQLERVEEIIAKKRSMAERYNKILKNVPEITTPPEKEYVRNVYWMYGIRIEDKSKNSRDEVKKILYNNGIDSRFFFTGMHKQPSLKEYVRKGDKFPVTDSLERKGLYLPSSTNLTDKQIEYICNTLIKAVRKK